MGADWKSDWKSATKLHIRQSCQVAIAACFALRCGKAAANAMENTFFEEMKGKGRDLVDKVKSIVHEGNARRIILKDEKGQTFLEIPLSIAAVGVIAAPLLAGLGAIAALVANFTLVVERVSEPRP